RRGLAAAALAACGGGAQPSNTSRDGSLEANPMDAGGDAAPDSATSDAAGNADDATLYDASGSEASDEATPEDGGPDGSDAAPDVVGCRVADAGREGGPLDAGRDCGGPVFSTYSVYHGTGYLSQGLAIGDVNSDGTPDLVILSIYSGTEI